ncbi:MAG TPA: hypothetical protein VEF55_05845, partial [Candidatus Binatia bacterium]|nr:hypothetical protein [Candidatus Binatia bacterium]
FTGGLAALVWIGGAIGGPISYFGVDGVMGMDPAMQAGLIALAFGPALLFWVAASAAGEALKARRLAVELTRIAHEQRLPVEAAENEAQRLTNTVKHEIENLNDAVAAALGRLAELETAAQRNATLFGEAIEASRENTQVMSDTLRAERDALVELNGDLKGQTETLAGSIGRQVRLMREASKLVKTEVSEAEAALASHLASFADSANDLGERTAEFHAAADAAAAATVSLNGTMTQMLDGLSEATRLTETAKKSTAEAVLAANETASAVRETTRAAVSEAKRAAQLIRAETAALQDAAVETLTKLQEAAEAARAASQESQAAADYHAASIEKRLSALASTATAKKIAQQRPAQTRPVERKPDTGVALAGVTSLQAAADAAVARSASRPQARATFEQTQPRNLFKGFGGWNNFVPSRNEVANEVANEDTNEDAGLVDFGTPLRSNPDDQLKTNVVDMVFKAGVDLDDVLAAGDLERIARCSRDGASARRRAVIDAAPGAVTRIARQIKRNTDAHTLASTFRSRPDLAKSEKKGEGSDLVRAYLLIDAALAS